MICNDRQYMISRAAADKFRSAITSFSFDSRPSVHPDIQAAELAGLKSQLASLETEIQDYEKIRGE